MLPDAFIRVKFWGVSWEAFQVDFSSPTLNEKVFYFLRAMDHTAVPNHQQLTTQVLIEVSQKRDAFTPSQCPPSNQARQLSSRCNATHHREMIFGLKHFHQWCLTARRISPDQARQQIESRFIYTDQVTMLATGLFLRFGQTSLRQRATSWSLRWVARVA